MAGLGGCVDNIAARAHAEGVDAPAGPRLMRQLVGSGRQALPGPAVLGQVDHRLRVFNADARGKGLRLHRKSEVMEHEKCISGRMPRGKDRQIRRYNL